MAHHSFISSSKMKKRILSIFVIILVIVICTIFVRVINNKLLASLPHVDVPISDLNYSLNKAKSDVLILGASQAKYNYDCKVIEDSLGLSTYNSGYNSSDCIFHQMIFDSFLERNHPKIVIMSLGVSRMKESWKSIYDSKLFYGKSKHVRKAFDKNNISWAEKLKLNIGLVQANHSLVSLLSCYRRSDDNNYKGFTAKDAVLTEQKVKTSLDGGIFYHPLEQLESIKHISNVCRNNNILFVACFAPVYDNKDQDFVNKMVDYCEKNDIMVLNHYHDSIFSNDIKLFCDVNHLNRNGATKYSQIIASEVKRLFDNKK